MTNKYTDKVKEIILSHKPGWVFSHVDFSEVGNLATVERILSRLLEEKKINRIRRGLYYIPELSRWGEVPPAQSEVVKALSRSMHTDFLLDGANALHKLGLTNQIPMKQVYLTDKQINTISIGKVAIEFRKVSSKKLSGSNNRAGMYLSAIEYLGKSEASQESMKNRVANILSIDIARELKTASVNRSAWVREVVDEIVTRVA